MKISRDRDHAYAKVIVGGKTHYIQWFLEPLGHNLVNYFLIKKKDYCYSEEYVAEVAREVRREIECLK